MIETLLAFGCSHTQGEEAVSDYNDGVDPLYNMEYAYPKYLSEFLNCKTYYNYAKVGFSNLEIAMSIFKEIKNYDPRTTFIIIGWTDDNRLPVKAKSEKILRKLYNSLPILQKVFLYSKIKNRLLNTTNTSITISKAIIRLVYQKLLINNLLTRHSKNKINLNFYKERVAPFFSDEFILGLDKHYFGTEYNTFSNFLYKKAVDDYLHKQGFSFLAFSTSKCDMEYRNFNSLYFHNAGKKYQNIIHEFGLKYGISTSGSHMKTQAHKKLAEHLYTLIKTRLCTKEL